MSQTVPAAHPLETRVLLAGIEQENSWTLNVYQKSQNGYDQVEKVLKSDPASIIDEVKNSGLRGLGGAGFPAGVKWSFIPKNSQRPVYLVCNADEGEPGTFKDRQIMEHAPHRLIEGMLYSAKAVGSHVGYIYVRCELRLAIERLESAIDEAYKAGLLGKNIKGSGFDFDLTVHPGGGAYICGEETGLIESLEGNRGQPRFKPPFPAVSGVFGGPTVVNNVATLAHVPWILKEGPEAFQKLGLGTARAAGTMIYSVSGDVQKPGYFELPLGFNLKTLLYDICGGPLAGRNFKACFPGGSSSPLLSAAEFDIKLDFDSLAAAKTMMGSGAIIVLDDRRSIPEVAMRTARFYAHESCGQCVPCREGTHWVYTMLKRLCTGEGRKNEIDLIVQACNRMAGKTICVLSDACAMPVVSMVTKFRSEFEALSLPDDHVAPRLPKVSGQLGGLMKAIRERQSS